MEGIRVVLVDTRCRMKAETGRLLVVDTVPETAVVADRHSQVYQDSHRTHLVARSILHWMDYHHTQVPYARGNLDSIEDDLHQVTQCASEEIERNRNLHVEEVVFLVHDDERLHFLLVDDLRKDELQGNPQGVHRADDGLLQVLHLPQLQTQALADLLLFCLHALEFELDQTFLLHLLDPLVLPWK